MRARLQPLELATFPRTHDARRAADHNKRKRTMGACSSKSTSNIADPVMQPEQISAPADTAAVVATPDVAPAETPAADAAAAPSTVTPA